MASKPKAGTKLPAKVKKGNKLPANYAGYDDYSGKGFQNQTHEDIAIPFLNILQPMSPEVVEKTVKGAEAGDLFNSVTQELYKSVEFIPAITQHVFVQWRKRDAGGGIVATHQLHDPIVKASKRASEKFGVYETPGEDGAIDDLVETYYVFGILIVNGSTSMATIAFTSTKIKAYKAIMGRLNSFQIELGDDERITPPLFAHRVVISTTSQKNTKGTFYVPVIQPAVENDVQMSLMDPESHPFKMAAECERLVDSGEAKADEASQKVDAPRTEDQDDGDLF